MPFLFDGATLHINDGAASAYVSVPGVISMTPPEEETGSYDSTALDTTAGSRTKKPLSRSEPGTFSWVMWNASNQRDRLEDLRVDKTECNFKITYPTGSADVDIIPAFISKVAPGEMGIDDPAKLTVTCVLTGPVSRTPGTAYVDP